MILKLMGKFTGSVYAREWCFFAALAIYAAFSSPTPDMLGWAEIGVLLLLLLSAAVNIARFSLPANAMFIVYGFTLPGIAMLIAGNNLTEALRDMIAFIFLLLPMFFEREKNRPELLAWGITGIGIIFALRSIAVSDLDMTQISSWLGAPADLLYLANSPEVLFAVTFLAAAAMRGFLQSQYFRGFLMALLCMMPLLAMAMAMQRAGLFYAVFIFFTGCLYALWRRPSVFAIITLLVICLISVFYDMLSSLFVQLSLKTQLVGLNSRVEEWGAVWEEISTSFWSFFFGKGWGAEFENPAVGNLRVGFTHSLLSFLLLKTGMTGLSLFLVYGFAMLRSAWPGLMANKSYLFSLAGPLLIGLALYANYKSFGYGLLLLLLASNLPGKKLEPFPPNMS